MIVPATKLPDESLDTIVDAVFALVALLVTVNAAAPVALYVADPANPVPETERVSVGKVDPSAVPDIVEFTNLLLAIDPANIVLVTVPVSPVVTIVPAVAGSAIVVVPATAGADIVIEPEVAPGSCTVGVISPFLTTNSLAISFPYPRVNYTTIVVLDIFIVADAPEAIVTKSLTFPPLMSLLKVPSVPPVFIIAYSAVDVVVPL